MDAVDRESRTTPRALPTPDTEPYFAALAEERVVLQHCDACDRFVHYPRHRCPHCLSDQLSWRASSGTGTVFTFSVARQPTAPMFVDEVPQVIAVVELPEGVRITSTIVGCDPAAVRCGAAVVPVFDHRPGSTTLLRHRLA